MKNEVSARIIADSTNRDKWNRITTFILVFPRIILAEANTHRVFSRNSASSRAIPFEKMCKMVMEDPFVPIKWMKDHKGMQGTEYLDERDAMVADSAWHVARDRAVEQAKAMSARGVTKQICNRLLEPFMWHTVIMTATEFENFFALRAHPAAEIHMQILAEKMLEAYNNSTPAKLKAGEWHIPFGENIDDLRCSEALFRSKYNQIQIPKESVFGADLMLETKIKIATARCARVSYLNFEGKDDYQADIELHDNLLKSGHFSPFEHCARVMNEGEYFREYGVRFENKSGSGWCGNFKGFIQYRKLLNGENKNDHRVVK